MLPEDLNTLLENANTSLEEAAGEVTNRAFNLGCLVGLTPAAVMLLVMVFITGFSIIGASMALVLTVLGMVAFANLAAAIARHNALIRVYQQQVLPDLTAQLSAAGLTLDQAGLAAHQALPPAAPLLAFLPNPAIPKEEHN